MSNVNNFLHTLTNEILIRIFFFKQELFKLKKKQKEVQEKRKECSKLKSFKVTKITSDLSIK